MKSIRCPYCGSRIEARSALCPHCGRPLRLTGRDRLRRLAVYLATSGLFFSLVATYNQSPAAWVGFVLAGIGILLFIYSLRR
jgi:hypothetical protein